MSLVGIRNSECVGLVLIVVPLCRSADERRAYERGKSIGAIEATAEVRTCLRFTTPVPGVPVIAYVSHSSRAKK